MSRIKAKSGLPLAAFLGAALLGGCSWFEDKPQPAAATGTESGIPSVNSVPNQRPRSTLINLATLGGGLGSDSGHAAYSGELIPVIASVPRPEPAPPPPPVPAETAAAAGDAPPAESAAPEAPAPEAAPAAPPAAPVVPLGSPAPQLGEGGAVEGAPADAAAAPALPEGAAAPAYGYAAPAAAPEAPAPAPLGGGPIALIYFDANSTELGPDDLDVVAKIVDLQRQYGGIVRIIGHASRQSGSPEENEKISMDRAHAIADALSAAGLAPGSILVAAAGDSQAAPDSDEALNRRAEIFLTPY